MPGTVRTTQPTDGGSTVARSPKQVGLLSHLERRPGLLGWFLAGPAFLLAVGMYVYPILYAFLTSLYDVHMLRRGAPKFLAMIGGLLGMREEGLARFLGLGNYARALTDAQVLKAARTTLQLTALSVPIELVFALIVALILNQEFLGRGLVRGALVLSWATPGVVNAILWKLMLRTDGILNGILVSLRVLSEPKAWLFSTGWAYFWVIIAGLWKGSPFAALVILSGLQSIPKELYDAAHIDGAGSWASFRHITLPNLRYVIALLVVLAILRGLMSFELLFILTAGGPGDSTRTLSYYSFSHVFEWDNLGYSASLSFWLTSFVSLFALLYWRLMRRRG